MTNKMSLIVVKKTDHVLAVVTRESDPEGPLEPVGVAGEELLVRYAGDPTAATFNDAQFLVPANELAVEVKDFDEVVVTRPREFCLNADKQVVGTAGSNTVSNPAPANTQIKIDVGGNVAAKTPVWLQVTSAVDPTNRQVRQGEIDVGQREIDIDVLPLDSGDHYVLAFAAGRELRVHKITI